MDNPWLYISKQCILVDSHKQCENSAGFRTRSTELGQEYSALRDTTVKGIKSYWLVQESHSAGSLSPMWVNEQCTVWYWTQTLGLTCGLSTKQAKEGTKAACLIINCGRCVEKTKFVSMKCIVQRKVNENWIIVKIATLLQWTVMIHAFSCCGFSARVTA